MNSRNSHGKDSDEERESAEFQLPLLGLYADLELGCGSVHLPDEFNACSSALRIEVINDWLRGLEECRQRALVQLYQQLAVGRDELSPPERLLRFRATCVSLGIDVPADFAVQLQQY